MAICDNIKKYRLKAGLTQKELATELGNAEITIRQYESGKREPSFKKLFDIAEALNVSITDIMSEDEFNKAAMDTGVKSLENLTIQKARAFLELGCYKLKKIDSENFLIYTDIEYSKIKEIVVDLGDLSELEMWIDEYVDKAVAYIYNSKNTPNYKPTPAEMPYYIDSEAIEKMRKDSEMVDAFVRDYIERHSSTEFKIPSMYQIQRESDLERLKDKKDKQNSESEEN